MASLEEFLFFSTSDVAKLELIEISHPSFSKTYRIVRNKCGGCTATIDGVPQTFEYYPLRLKAVGTYSDLNFGYSITLGDLGTIIPDEIKRARAAGTMTTKPQVRVWWFRSDNLTSPIMGPVTLEVSDLVRTREGAQFDAKPPTTDVNRTGIIYSPSVFTTLHGLV